MPIKFHEPIGNGLYAGLLVRVPLGLYFVLAGLFKLKDPDAFVAIVQQKQVLPEPLGTLYGILLPYVEVGAGTFLIFGMWTTLAAIITSLMLLSFIIALGIRDHQPFNKDILLLGAALSLLYSGAGAFSIDRFRKTG
jgi:uncharacterized membrane protein YphA (DoxX/SURF4 family)